jgi:SCY1-like protein 1
MENIALKDSSEKDLFFKKLPAMIPAIPEPVAVRKILPQLSNALEYGGAPATAVSSLLMIGRWVPAFLALSLGVVSSWPFFLGWM